MSEKPASRALDVLRRFLRDPVPPFESPWISCREDGDDEIDLNLLLPLVNAWKGIHPETGASAVRAVFDAGGEDGSLPRFIAPGTGIHSPRLPWPLLARCVWRAGPTAVAGANPENFLERLRAYLGWAIHVFDPERIGRPAWPNREEAFIPETWDPDLYPVDLAVFLLAELEAYDAIQIALNMETGDDPRVPERYRETLSHHLCSFLWDAKTRRFSDRYRDGKKITRITLSAATPLLLGSLAAPFFDAVRPMITPSSPLLSKNGLALWERWDDDLESPPAPLLQQAVLYDAFSSSRLASEKKILDQALLPLFKRFSSRGGQDSPRYSPSDAPAGNKKTDSNTLVAAAFALSSVWRSESMGENTPTWLRWIDRHTRFLLWCLAVGLLLASLTVLFLPRFFPHSGEGPTLEGLTGLAQRYYLNKHYEEAGELYSKILNKNRLPIAVFRQGNVCFRQHRFSKAETFYREAMKTDSLHVRARFNLAQSLIQQGETNEATDHLETIISDYSLEYPEVAQLAKETLKFLNHLAESKSFLRSKVNEPIE